MLLIVFVIATSFAAMAEDYIILQYKTLKDTATKSTVSNKVKLDFKDNNLSQFVNSFQIYEYEKEFPSAYKFPLNIKPAQQLKLFYKIRLLGETASLQTFLKGVNKLRSSDIDTAFIGHDFQLLSGGSPNDYYNILHGGTFPEAFNHLDLINAKGAWDITRGIPCIKIGITDIGFYHHADLDNNLEVTSNTAYQYPAASTNPLGQHGTETAGVAGAETNNSIGVSSLGYNVKISLYEGLNYNAITDAINDGCKVVNCSWGLYSGSTILQAPPPQVISLTALADLYNVTLVAAAGNAEYGGADTYVYPASYDRFISVSSVGSQWDAYDYTNAANWKDCHQIFMDPLHPRYGQTHQHNDQVDICAPGHYISTTGANNGYALDEGTSLSSPMVAAAAALLYSVNKNFTADQIRYFLLTYASSIEMIYNNNDWWGQLGAGRLNAGASLLAASAFASTPTYIYDIEWYGDYDFSTEINPNDYYQYRDLNLRIRMDNPCDLWDREKGIEWVVQWGDEEKHYFGQIVDIRLDDDFTVINPRRACTFNEIKVLVRNQNCEDDCSYSVYYIETGNANISCRGVKSNEPIPKIENGIKIFPSPANDHINVNIALQKGVDVSMPYGIYNTKGQLIKSGMITNATNKINISGIPKGLYYFKLYNKNYSSKSFLKL